MIRLDEERNFYFVSQHDSQDAALGDETKRNVLAVGNALLQGYTLSASVGDFARSTLNYTALNVCINEGSTGLNPAINYIDGSNLSGTYSLPIITSQVYENDPNTANNVTAIHSKDIVLMFSTGAGLGVELNNNSSGSYGCPLQNFNFSMTVDRESAISMGQKYPQQRPIIYPVTVELQAEAHLSKFAQACLNNNFCNSTQHTVNILMKQPCSELAAFELRLSNLQLVKQEFVANMGDIDVVSFTWNGVIRSPFDTGSNFFITAYEGTELWVLESCFPVSGVS